MPLKIYTEEEVKMIREDDEQLKQFHRISAAGGLVLNDKEQLLFIFRRGKWDLPKGKLEPGEALEICAERETKEETGLTELTLQKFIITTYHTYAEKKQLILKDTHWFLFSTPGIPQLTPQTEEDITKAVWVDQTSLEAYTSNTYLLIRDVLEEAFSQRRKD
jgi:8-oxo-dGTP pyrophosphatase MutT (NUDIX family)